MDTLLQRVEFWRPSIALDRVREVVRTVLALAGLEQLKIWAIDVMMGDFSVFWQNLSRAVWVMAKLGFV